MVFGGAWAQMLLSRTASNAGASEKESSTLAGKAEICCVKSKEKEVNE